MKRIIAILLSVLMVLALFTTAFAEDDETTPEPTVNYKAYQLLTLTSSLKPKDSCTCEGIVHGSDDNCYNYAYAVNGKYREVLQTAINDADATDAEIIEHLSKLTSDELRPIADAIYRAIKDSIAADATSSTTTFEENVTPGYWLVADVKNLDGENEANSLVMVDTGREDSITFTPKTDMPTVEKKVQDINDSDNEDGDITDNAWQDSADHDIGDAVPFKLTATLPSNIGSYETYKLVFHDTMSAGLTLDADSFKVYVFDSKAAADADPDLSDNEPIDNTNNANYVVKTTGLTDGCTFEVEFADVKTIAGANAALVVYYEATLNEGAKIGSAGNRNTVHLQYSNNPYGDGTGKTPEDKVIVFTYKLVINKTDAAGKPLAGAGFTLSKKNADGDYEDIGEELTGGTTFTWTGLDDGDYKLVETTVPAGYNKMEDIEFTITAEHEVLSDNPALTKLSGGDLDSGEFKGTGVIETNIVNNTGIVLPETGAEGTVMLISVSALVVFMAAVFMITRKKMSIYED